IAEIGRQMAHDPNEGLIVEIGYQDADGIRPAAPQAGRGRVRTVAHRLGRLADAFAGLLTDEMRLVGRKGARNGRAVDTERPRQLAHVDLLPRTHLSPLRLIHTVPSYRMQSIDRE